MVSLMLIAELLFIYLLLKKTLCQNAQRQFRQHELDFGFLNMMAFFWKEHNILAKIKLQRQLFSYHKSKVQIQIYFMLPRQKEFRSPSYSPQRTPKPDTKRTNRINETAIPQIKKDETSIYIEDPQYSQQTSKIKFFQNNFSSKLSTPRNKKHQSVASNHYNLYEHRSKSKSPRQVEWNSSVNVQDIELVKDLNTKILVLSSQNKKLKNQLKEARKAQKQSLKKELFPHHHSEHYIENNYHRKLETIHRTESLEKKKLQEQNERLLEENRKLSQEIHHITNITKTNKSNIHQISKKQENNRDALMKCSREIENYYANKMHQLQSSIRSMNMRLTNAEKLINNLLRERNVKISNAMQQTKLIVSQFPQIHGDTDIHYEPYAFQEQKFSGKIAKFESLQKLKQQKEKNEKKTSENQQLASQLMGKKNQITQITNECRQLQRKLEEKQVFIEKIEKNMRKYEKIKQLIEKLKIVKETLDSCPEQNFDILNNEIIDLLKQRTHLMEEVSQYRQNKESKKAWQLQKSLNDSRKKNKQLVHKCVQLQNYIQKNIRQNDESIFWSQGIFQHYYVHGCTCEIEKRTGQDALKWNNHVKQCVNESSICLSQIIREYQTL